MSNFWESRTGAELTGNPEDAFTPQFDIIPDGTTAPAAIKAFELITKEIMGEQKRFYQITWRLTDGQFKNRQVTQKIKALDDKSEIAQRGLNMMKLIYSLCNHVPKHGNMPTDDDHKPLIGKILGIKIGEWSMPRRNEPGFMEGNHVTEVHKMGTDFRIAAGVKKELPKVTTSAVESAFSRNPRETTDPNDVPW